MAHAISLPTPPRLDPARIAAEAGTIALNGVLLLALLVPLSAPLVLAPEPPDAPEVTIVEPVKPKPVLPIPVPVPVQQRPTPPRPAPTVAPPQRIEPPAVLVEGAGEPYVAPADPVDEPPAVDGGDRIGPRPEPAAGAQLRYASAPPPTYPREAMRAGLTGVVMLQVLVDVDGRPLQVSVQRSSGHRALDLAARRQVLAKWRFEPAVQDGRPVQAIGIVPVEFSLDR